MSDGTALRSGLDFIVVVIPSLLLVAAMLHVVCGRPQILGSTRIHYPHSFVLILAAVLLANLALLLVSLNRWGDQEIRTQLAPQICLTLFGQFLLFIPAQGSIWFGISFREDAIERRNPAALAAMIGAICACNFIWTGANLGDGPSYANNFFSAFVGLFGFSAAWALLEAFARVSESIAEERDLASGIRLGACLLCAGLIFGRAVVGNWHSMEGTARDFLREGYVGFFLFVLEIVMHRAFRPTAAVRPFPGWRTFGVGPAILYGAITFGWLVHLGPWEGCQ